MRVSGAHVISRVLHEATSSSKILAFLDDWRMLHPELHRLDSTVASPVYGDGASILEVERHGEVYQLIESTTY